VHLAFDLAKIRTKASSPGFDTPMGPLQIPKSPTRSHLGISMKSKKSEKIEVMFKLFSLAQ